MQSTNKALTSTDWKALLDTEANEQGCSVAQPTPPQGWYHTCYVWSIIAMASYVNARDSGHSLGDTLRGARRRSPTVHAQRCTACRSASGPAPGSCPRATPRLQTCLSTLRALRRLQGVQLVVREVQGQAQGPRGDLRRAADFTKLDLRRARAQGPIRQRGPSATSTRTSEGITPILHAGNDCRARPRRSLDVPSTPRLRHQVVDLLRDLEPCTFPSAAYVHWPFRQDP